VKQSCVRHRVCTEGETEALAAQLARARPGGEELAVVFLSGELGAGKTTFVRGYLRSLGVTRTVRSPTYTLVELYPQGTVTVVHADLYRVRDAGELETLGLRDWAQRGHLWFVEWPERGAGHLPAPDLQLDFSAAPDAHAIELQARSALGQLWLSNLQGGCDGLVS
jgi:tRNA threonylcarbamoyl adenosine modification protein YjeE